MKVAVLGLWHLGSVTAAALASRGVQVVGWDPESSVIANLSKGEAPLFEPNLNELIKSGLQSKQLVFTNSLEEAVRDGSVIWITFDTPVDDDDRADVEAVVKQVKKTFPFLSAGAVVLSSSQLPVGTILSLKAAYQSDHPDTEVGFAVSPENLRLGKAIELFLNPDRIIVGVDNEKTKERSLPLLSVITDRVEFMSVPSGEMVKHAINAFLATSVTFINEIASICELAGADAKEVERGLKTESRIGPKAYLSPGGPFAGGTLARDVEFLSSLSAKNEFPASLINAIKRSNLEHKSWELRTLLNVCGTVRAKKVAILGLTYKADTNTLRRSRALELATELAGMGAELVAWDPRVTELPPEFSGKVSLVQSLNEALEQCDAAIICTGSPEIKEMSPDLLNTVMRTPHIIDINRTAQHLAVSKSVSYHTLGSVK